MFYVYFVKEFFKRGIFENKEKLKKHGIFENVLQSSGFFSKTRVFENVMKRPGFFKKPELFENIDF